MNNSSIIMYRTEGGLTMIKTTFDEDTLWLPLNQMAELFQRNKSIICRHIKIFPHKHTPAEIIFKHADAE